MIDDRLLKARRNRWLTSTLYRTRYIEIRTVVEGLFKESEQTTQIKWFTPHGIDHCKALENNLYDLIPDPVDPEKEKERAIQTNKLQCNGSNQEEPLTEVERFYLIISAWLHDLGMIKQDNAEDAKKSEEELRNEHHTRSENYIVEHFAKLKLHENEATIFGQIAFYHRRRCSIQECMEKVKITEYEDVLRVRLLAAYVRLADAMHADITRVPAHDYAILLTYNIPAFNKIHWLKSHFVLGMTPDLKDKSITITLKRPTDEVIKQCVDDTHYNLDENCKKNTEDQKNNKFKCHVSKGYRENQVVDEIKNKLFETTLNSIYNDIYNDLQEELNSVKEVLIRGGVSSFLSFKKEIVKVQMKRSFINELKTILHHYPSINNPSGTSLYRIIIDTLLGICEMVRDHSEEIKKDRIENFLNDIKENIIEPRKSYVSLNNLYDNIKMICDAKSNKRAVLIDILEGDCKDSGKEVENRIEEIEKQKQKCKDSPLSELEIFLFHKHDVMNKRIKGVRDNARNYYSHLIEGNSESENSSKEKSTELCIYEDFVNRLIQSLEVEKKAPNTKEDDQPNEQVDKAIADKQDKDGSPEGCEKIREKKIDILLYGYSELVVKTLSGFRDAVLKKMLKDILVKDIEFFIHKIDLEKTASDIFRIFICEGQPKNRLDWGNKSVYHDGTNYALKLHEFGFTNIHLIPDATAATLLDSKNTNLNIDFILMGANKYEQNTRKQNEAPFINPMNGVIMGNNDIQKNDILDVKSFTHSAGHAMITALMQQLKSSRGSEQKNNIKLVFAVTTDKEVPRDNNGSKDNEKTKEKKPLFDKAEGLYFRRFIEDETIKKRRFFAYTKESEKSITKAGCDILIYNPKEDEIPGRCADVLITEHTYYDKKETNEP